MLTIIRQQIRMYEEHIAELIEHGYEPNETILQTLEHLKMRARILEAAGA